MKKIFPFTFFLFISSFAYAAAPGEKIYLNNCSLCHGQEGKGDGPVGTSLDPKPANFDDIFTKKFYKTPAELKKHILLILENGKPPSAMPSFKNLSSSDKNNLANYLISKHYKAK